MGEGLQVRDHDRVSGLRAGMAAVLCMGGLAGCSTVTRPGGLGIGASNRNAYACQPASQALPTSARAFNFYPGPGPSFDAYFDPRAQQVVLTFYRSAPRRLSAVPGGAGVLYADGAFAWNDQGTAGILTDQKYSLVYGCAKLA
jgi:membrane-bound inhibitor of C-type lysozyme